MNEKEIATRASTDISSIQFLRQRAGALYAAPFKSSKAILAESSYPPSLHFRPFGCEGYVCPNSIKFHCVLAFWTTFFDFVCRLDILLDGGTHSGDIIELSGSTSVGKTQLCLLASLCSVVLQQSNDEFKARRKSQLGTVLYVDTANSFSPRRILELFNGGERFAPARKLGIKNEDVLSCIRVAKCYDVHDFVALLSNFEHGLEERSSSPFYSRMELLVVDSIASLLSPVLSMKHSAGQTLMASITRSLRRIATQHNVAVVLVNHAVSSRNEEGETMGTKPALGKAWQGVPTVRLFLKHDVQDDAGDTGGREGLVWSVEVEPGKVMKLSKRIVEVRSSSRMAIGGSMPIFFGQTDIITDG